MLTERAFLIAGFTDANADPTDLNESVESFSSPAGRDNCLIKSPKTTVEIADPKPRSYPSGG
jgi:hypothetical protein